MGIELDSEPDRGRAEEEKRRKADERARQAAGPRKVLPSLQSLEVFRDRLRSGREGPAMVVLPTGKGYRLPSESEWEYAARAGTETAYSWGDEIGHNRANCDGCDSKWDNKKTSPVGSFEPNAFGLYDMHGNVYEWAEDCWHDNYEGAPSDGSAWTSGGDSSRAVVRGGSWSYNPRYLRAANRDRVTPSNRGDYSGFRLVQDLNP